MAVRRPAVPRAVSFPNWLAVNSANFPRTNDVSPVGITRKRDLAASVSLTCGSIPAIKAPINICL